MSIAHVSGTKEALVQPPLFPKHFCGTYGIKGKEGIAETNGIVTFVLCVHYFCRNITHLFHGFHSFCKFTQIRRETQKVSLKQTLDTCCAVAFHSYPLELSQEALFIEVLVQLWIEACCFNLVGNVKFVVGFAPHLEKHHTSIKVIPCQPKVGF